MPDLAVENLSKDFASHGAPLPILRNVNFTLSAGENLAILGPSGCGKSTLLHIVGGLDRPTAGNVRLGTQDIFDLREDALAKFRNEHIGFIFQDHHLLPQLSVLENVLIPALAFGKPTDEHHKRAVELIQRVGLAGRISHRPAELSGGERQRAGVARAMLLRPKLLLADEPTGNLDRINSDTIGAMLLDMQKSENTMLIVVTHSQQLADRMQRRHSLMDGVLVSS